MDSRILSGKKSAIAAVAVAVDEAITREGYDLSVDIELSSPALLKVKSTVVAGSIKVTLAAGTIMTIPYSEVNEANVHVEKVFKTGTDLATTDFYLWQ